MEGSFPFGDWGGAQARPFAPPHEENTAHRNHPLSTRVARIWKPARSAMTSGRARGHLWKMRIERARASWIEPLMGWTAGDDPAAYVEIDFPDLEAAINHARRLGVDYEVHMPPAKNGPSRPVPAGVR